MLEEEEMLDEQGDTHKDSKTDFEEDTWSEDYLSLPNIRTACVKLGGGDNRDRESFCEYFQSTTLSSPPTPTTTREKVIKIPVYIPCHKLSTSVPDATERRRNSRGVLDREVGGMWEYLVKEIGRIGGRYIKVR